MNLPPTPKSSLDIILVVWGLTVRVQKGEEMPMMGDSKTKSKEFFENLPSFVKGDSVVEGKDIRVIDIGSAIGFACILVYVFRNVIFK